jgi:hypothetical protein
MLLQLKFQLWTFQHVWQDFLWTLNFCRFWPIMQIRKKGGWNLKKIFSSETTVPISTKLFWNDSWTAPFQNCVRWSRLPTKMAAPGACNRSPGSKLLSITTQLHCGGHPGGRAQLPETILEEDHPMTMSSKFGFNWATGSRQDAFYVNFP